MLVCLPLLCFALQPPAKTAPVKPSPTIAKPNTQHPHTGAVPTPNTQAPAKPKPAGPVWSVAFSPDGKTLAVGGYRCVRLYEVATGKRTVEYPVTGEAVRSVCFSADGKELAVGTGIPGQGGAAFVLDPTSGKLIREIKGHDDTVEAVTFMNNVLLSAADDERVLLTDVTSGQIVGKLTEHNGRCLSVAVPTTFNDDMGGDIFATGGADNMFKVWDAKARRVVVNFDQCASPVWSVAPRPPHAGRFITGSGDGRLRYFVVYRDKNGKPDEQGVWPRGGNQEAQFDAHEGGVYAVADAPNDSFVVTGGADHTTAVWNTGGGKRKVFDEATGDIWGVAISPDSKLVASASLDGKARLYDAAKLQILLTLDANGVYIPPPTKLSPLIAAALPARFGAGTGLTGTYINDREGNGKPALVRTDASVDITINADPPASGVNRENLFVRWEGILEAPVTGNYKFWTRTDDGVRLWISGKQVINAWNDRGATDDQSESILLKAGQRVPIKMEYFQGGGGGEAHLSWEYTGTRFVEAISVPVNQPRQIIPKEFLYPLIDTKTKDKQKKPAPAPRTPAKVALGKTN